MSDTVVSAVPRHLFIPDVAMVGAIVDDPDSWIDRTTDPDRWWQAVNDDRAIVTQLNDGAVDLADKTGADPAALPTCSCSAPSLVRRMLELLDVERGHKVLEIGTGTGWTAGLLTALGADVVTVEIDPALAAQARANLTAAGLSPTVVVADGADGYEPAAPYDRVHVTCGVATVPYAWVEQTRPGGVIVAPWTPGWTSGHLVRLTVTADGTASGPIGDRCAFMLMRDQRPAAVPLTGEPRETWTCLDPRELGAAGDGLAVAIAGLLPGVSGGGFTNADGTYRLGARQGDSHALVVAAPGRPGAEVTQSGPRNLWDEIATAYHRWVAWGRPDKSRFGLSVTPHGTHVWLDRPDRPVQEL
ncbi:protein-L-isoaspartate O-methyltransferase [Actinomadura rubrobrunea]|uniref:Protein-L-isoaspartate O-methyltransferase n=1 Tax=Actinomadura rubrobrunea TaxID=115335 RepID=A0A9W6Q0Z3_9ACTN|nr:methyltransferase domain-containing protein [Actinomadura rubrobrunea]GLW66458.1 protein-L-isoaspartate O-methyltransferase [Actinomadura rubrobrunea]